MARTETIPLSADQGYKSADILFHRLGYMMPHSLLVSLTLIASLSFEPTGNADENTQPVQSAVTEPTVVSTAASEPALTTEQVRDTIERLADPQFSVRQKSLVALRSVTADQVALLAEATENHRDNEVARRCAELLERIYSSGDRDSVVVRQASDAIETAANSERWFIAESAQDALERHWKRRVEIAMLELQKLGANMRPRDPSKLWESNASHYPSSPTDDGHLKVCVDASWKADANAIELMKRLTPLLNHDVINGRSRLSFVMIDGHTQTPEEISQAKAIFGDINVTARGEVYLGIGYRQTNADRTGVQIDSVGNNSSASKAGLKARDVLLKFEGKPLKEFDELIEFLKAYRVNDEVTFQVNRDDVNRDDFETPDRTFDVKVKLLGWYER